MFEQVDRAFQKGMSEHAVAIQQQVEAAHTPLVLTLKVGYLLFGMAGGKLVERVRALSFQSIMHQEVAWFDDPSNSRFVTYFSLCNSIFICDSMTIMFSF